MGDCLDYADLERHLAGELDTETSARIEAHLDACDSCRERRREIEENLEVVSSLRGVVTRYDAPPPARIGDFEVIRELGRGGMGVVYLAAQEHPRREVALKVINPASASPQALKRFVQEVEVLGQLKHPGIAQIYDAGVAKVGPEGESLPERPFFVMEYVQGQPLDDFVRNRDLGLRPRLELLARICDAVHYAHLKGVVHRDLKPSNILVTEGEETRSEEEGGRPKILDFGVARATDADLQTVSMQTDTGQLVGTLPYMSPEQVSGDPQRLDARSDVYALGVLGFELIAGCFPYVLQNRSIPEVVRVITEDEPTRLGTLNSTFRGDIETIFAKALEKELDRRYPSAAELAADLRRYLAHQPIEARPPSTLYQLRKFSERNRVLVGSVATIMIVLVAATSISITQAVKATRAESSAGRRLKIARAARALAQKKEQEARSESAKHLEIRRFLEETLTSIDPNLNPGETDVSVRTVMDRASERLGQGSLDGQPEVKAVIETTIGDVYRALGAYEAAEPLLREAVSRSRELYPEDHADLANSLHKLARLLESSGELEEAESLYREALEMRTRLFGEGHVETQKVQNNLGLLLQQRGDFDEAEALLTTALARAKEIYGPEHAKVATGMNNLALVYQSQGRFDEAEELLRESLAMDRKLRGEHPDVAFTMVNLGVFISRRGKHEEAEALLRDALRIFRKTVSEEHPSVATILNNLAHIVVVQRRLDEAEALYRESLALGKKLKGEDHPEVATTLANLSDILLARGQTEEPIELLRQALAIHQEKFGEKHPQTAITSFKLSSALSFLKHDDEAEPFASAAVVAARASLPPEHPHLGLFLLRLGECLAALERYPEAEPRLQEAHRILVKNHGTSHPRVRQSIRALVQVYRGLGRADEASSWESKLTPSTGGGP